MPSLLLTKKYTTRWGAETGVQVYQSVISKERKGEYLGKTVQVVPHITDEIQVSKSANNNRETARAVSCSCSTRAATEADTWRDCLLRQVRA